MIDFRTAACTIGVTENELARFGARAARSPSRRRARSKAMSLLVAWSDDQLPALKGALSCGNNK